MDAFKDRFAAAKAARTKIVEEDGYEVYKFIYNGREDEWRSNGRAWTSEAEEIFTDEVATEAEDFTYDLFNTLTPENVPWVEYEAGAAVPEENVEQAQQLIEAREKIISKSIRDSNYYDEGPTAFQDAVIGNVVLWVDRYSFASAITCEAIPASSCYFRLGPFGIDDRFREEKFYVRDLKQLLPDATFPKKIQDQIDKGGRGKATVIWGFWRTYDDPRNPVWRQEVRVDGESVGMDQDLGPDGACPMLVGRFNPQPKTPWGRGPARRILPSLRTMDELSRMILEGMDHSLDPAYTYPNDGIFDASEGIESGLGYPVMPGSGDTINPIRMGELDYGYYSEERMLERIRHAFYRNQPQRGKTPPSASQYLGEEQKDVRRMGRPAGKLWAEFGLALLKRFEWLELQDGGVLQGEESYLNVGENVVSLRPISPLERAQAREEVLVAQSIMGMSQENLGPDQTALVIDGPKTMGNIKSAMKDKLVEIRSEEQMIQMMQQMQPQEQGEPGEGQG